MTLLRDNALEALRNLGADDHSTTSVWWAMSSAPYLRKGAVENALTDLWEEGLVEQRPHGRWRVAVATGRQTELLNEREN